MQPLLNRISPLSSNCDGGLFISHLAKAGVIVFHNGTQEPEFLLLHREKQDDWSFPKGHVEDEESLLEAGLRELLEETAIEPMILGRLTDLSYPNAKGEMVSLALFLGYISDDQEPKRSANEETARWVPLSSVLETLSYENLRSYFASFIAPLFIKTRKRKPLVVDVIFSKTEPYLSGTKQLVESIDTCGARGRYFELNQLAEKQKFSEKNRVIYFLTNDPDAQNAAFWMQDAQKCYVINAEYLRLWHSKSIVQALLKKHGVPILPSTPSLTNQNYAKKSFIIKGEYHGSRDEALLKNNANHHPWRVYSERRMQDKRFTEIKIGYVAGQLLAETPGMHFSQALRSALHRIYAHLGLEIFSVDLFISGTGAFYIIDVNPAPAFFHNAAARKSFGTYTKAISSLGAF